MHEIPLLIFTLLVQGSVGLTMFLVQAAFTVTKDEPYVNKQLLPAMLLACIAGALGLVASTLHLGYPLNAFNALRHVVSSWLSREIFFASIYLAILGLCTWILLVKKRLISSMLLLAAILGLIDVWCMSAIYAHSTIITWMHFNTWLMFYGSVGIIGAVALTCLLLFRISLEGIVFLTLIKRAAVMVVAIIIGRLMVQPAYMHYLSSSSLNDVVTLPHHPTEAFTQVGWLFPFTWIMSVMGAVLFTISGWHGSRICLISGSLLLVISEILFRYIFFSIH